MQSMNTEKSSNVSWIVLGCPHCSIWEIAQVADKLGSRKISPHVKFWVLTSVPMKALAERMGFVETIEKAGGVVVTETCPNIFTRRTYQNLNDWSLATNSVVMAHSMGENAGAPNPFKDHIHVGDLEQCLDAATMGKWR
jgi:predicted aconitase